MTRALLVADSDSYVKWAAALAADLPDDWDVHLIVLAARGAPSDRQVEDAVHLTGIEPDEVEHLSAHDLRRELRRWRPDVLVLGVRAHAVPHISGWFAHDRQRPVIVTGVAGIALPVQWYDVDLRRGADLFVTHSRREAAEIAHTAHVHEVPHRTTLATLPYLQAARVPVPVAGRRAKADAIVFAPQSLVPAADDDRRLLLRRLAETARAHPDLRVVVKGRTRDGESEAHRGGAGYAELAAETELPANLEFADGPMAEHLARATGFVTVSSSAVLEATAAGVPSLVLTDFGVDDDLMNSVFEGSGLFGSADDLLALRFAHADEDWARRNYFHDPAHDTWLTDLTTLLSTREAGLPAPARRPATLGARLRDLYYRHDALQPWHGTWLAPLERLMLWAGHVANRRLLHLR